MEIGPAVRSAGRSSVAGWRAWTVIETRDGVRLASVIYDTVWSPTGPTFATCRCEQSHAAPEVACTCGFYAAQDPVDALTYLQGRDEPRTLCRVLGECCCPVWSSRPKQAIAPPLPIRSVST